MMRWYKISKGTLVWPSTIYIVVTDAGAGGREKDLLVAKQADKYPMGVRTEVEWIFTSEDNVGAALIKCRGVEQDKGMVVMLHIPFSERCSYGSINSFIISKAAVSEVERE